MNILQKYGKLFHLNEVYSAACKALKLETVSCCHVFAQAQYYALLQCSSIYTALPTVPRSRSE